MPRKTTSKAPAHHTHAPYAPLFMVVIVALLTIGLLLIWRELPIGGQRPAPPANIPSVPAVPSTPEQAACEAAKGKWVECGNPCHGKPGEVCIASCEPQCLCGGIAGWMCPANQACTDYEPSASTPDAIGVCRAQVSEPTQPTPTEPIRPRPSGSICDDRNFICVDEDVENSLLTNPFIVTGSGIAFENTINWRLLDGKGQKLEEGFVTANAPEIGQAGDFEIRAFLLRVPTTSTGTLEVLEYSAKDGSPQHVVRIPVRLPTATMTVRYYSSTYRDQQLIECDEVQQQTATVPRSSLPVETTLRYLLAAKLWVAEGPTTGLRITAIPEGTRLESIKVSGGLATVVFSPELGNYGGGSCNVQAIRAQIEETLKQFSTVNRVEIIQQGKTAAETLQP